MGVIFQSLKISKDKVKIVGKVELPLILSQREGPKGVGKSSDRIEYDWSLHKGYWFNMIKDN